ncbi:MAG: zf-HC2 domain-containing protein [Burkholderiales bacterium]|nr:zf-HC2 domain-containing protein [Anaerolineae bacterium]
MSSIVRMDCRFCEAHLVAYLNGQLSAKARSRIARHVDECESCYAAYMNERDMSRELERRVPLVGANVGMGTNAAFARMWSAIEIEIPTSPAPAASTGWRWSYQLRYSLAALVFMLALLLPWTMEQHKIGLSLPIPPEPSLVIERGTPAPVISVALFSNTHPAATPTPGARTPDIESAPGTSDSGFGTDTP